jgi:hypothetical protein
VIAVQDIVVKKSGLINLKKIYDGSDGTLCIAESMRDLPFELKRLYYITNLLNERSVRGKHAHRNLWQAIFCISGSFTLGLDDGCTRQELRVWRSHQGVLLGPGLWHTMSDFSAGCVLLVAASDYYDERDYIRDYDEFLSLVKAGTFAAKT